MVDNTHSTENFTGGAVVTTVEDVIEDITNTQTPAASAGVLIDWIIQMIEGHPNGASVAAQTLKDNKESLSQAVAAGS